MSRQNQHFTDDEIKFLRKHADGKYVHELQVLFNKRFKSDRTVRSISGALYRNGIKTNMQGKETRFKKGHRSWNKGMKGLQLSSVATRFKKGNKPHSQLPVGTERVGKHNKVFIKIAEPNKWQLKHHYLYEQHVGEIPDGYVVLFADRDERNFDLSNLVMVRRSVLSMAVKRKLLFEDTELTQSGLLLAELMVKSKEFDIKGAE